MVMTYKAVAREVPEGWKVRMTVGHDVQAVEIAPVIAEMESRLIRQLPTDHTKRTELLRTLALGTSKERARLMEYYFGIPCDEPKAHFEERAMRNEMADRQKRLKAGVERIGARNTLHRALKAPAAVLGLGLILGGCQSTAGGGTSSRWSTTDLIAAVSTTCSFVVEAASADTIVVMLGPKYGTLAALARAVCASVNRVVGPQAARRAGVAAAPRVWGTLDGVQIVGYKR